MNFFLRLVLCSQIIFGGAFAQASLFRCEQVFDPSPTVLESMMSFYHARRSFLFDGSDISEYTSKSSFSKKQLRQIREMLEETRLHDLTSEKEVESFAIELAETLFGTNDNLDRWVKKGRAERLKESTILAIKEQILREGLLHMWRSSVHPDQIKRTKKILGKISSFQNTMLVQLLSLPFSLPSVNNRDLPASFILDVIQDGFDAHAEEAKVLMRTQTKIEAFNTFSRLYSAVVMSALVITGFANVYAEIQVQSYQQVHAAITEIAHTQHEVELQVSQVRTDILEKAYKKSVQEFTDTYGEPPTPTEQAELREKIAKALALNP